MTKLAFGCSHTYGVGVERTETWAYILGADNHGVSGCSSDFIARTAPPIIKQKTPTVVYILWPDWSRFEYRDNKVFVQSLPTDKNRIYFMEKATDEWLHDNFNTQVESVIKFCNSIDVKLVHMTLYDLVPHIGHADEWPLSKLGHHYSAEWHSWVANIFKLKEDEQT